MNSLRHWAAQWGDLASIAGLGLTIVGFVVTIVGIRRSRAAAEAAQLAAEATQASIAQYDAIADLSAATAIMDEIKRLLVDSVNIQHIPLSEITEATTLFGDGLGLDSVDVLEVVVAVERKYGLKVRDAKTGQKIFQSIGSIADFVAQQGSGTGSPA